MADDTILEGGFGLNIDPVKVGLIANCNSVLSGRHQCTEKRVVLGVIELVVAAH
jgi:hypothetical protein